MKVTKYVVDANQYDGATTVRAGPSGSSIREQARLLGWCTWSHLGKMSDKSSWRDRTHRAFIIIPMAIHIIDRLPWIAPRKRAVTKMVLGKLLYVDSINSLALSPMSLNNSKLVADIVSAIR